MQALINLGTAVLSALIVWGVITVFPESIEKVKKIAKTTDAGAVIIMWVAMAFIAFAAKDVIATGPMTQAIGGFFTSIFSGLVE